MTDIVLGDDHAAFADALAAVLENHGVKVLGVETTLDDLLAATTRWTPDLCLADRWFEDGDVIERLPEFRAAAPSAAVVVLSADPTRDTAALAIERGAHGFVHKTRGVAALLDALDRVVAGDVVVELPPRWTRQESPPEHVRPPTTPLTRREYECLGLLVEGASTVQMAGRLAVGTNTVRSHVQALLTKLGVHTRLEAAAYGVRHGLLESAVDRRA
ncbi:MAG: two-component system, NarL family, nitrate/nitrite response regulator NarL [Actinomycetota bacterium]|nr:two-component system, NarL family, nitrate/nitrite response regulator NarL [Actinomycetota bacterium]